MCSYTSAMERVKNSRRRALRKFAKCFAVIALVGTCAMEPALAVDRTALGLPCFKGMSGITAQEDGTFLVAGKQVEQSQLKTALSEARKLLPSDCLRIVGRTPVDHDEVMKLVKAFSPRPYRNVEWIYSRPPASHNQ